MMHAALAAILGHEVTYRWEATEQNGGADT